MLAQEWAQRQVINSLVSDVASAYFQLRELDLELEISRQTLASRQDSLRLTQMLADHGATSMLDVRQAEQLVFAAGASIPDLERRIEQQENFISILLGRNPEGVARGMKLVDQPHALEVPAGLPRRPTSGGPLLAAHTGRRRPRPVATLIHARRHPRVRSARSPI